MTYIWFCDIIYKKGRVIQLKVKFTTTIDSDLLERAKIQAIKEKKSVAKIIEKLLKKYLEEKGNNNV